MRNESEFFSQAITKILNPDLHISKLWRLVEFFFFFFSFVVSRKLSQGEDEKPKGNFAESFLQYGLSLATSGWVQSTIKVALFTVLAVFTIYKLNTVEKLETSRLEPGLHG